MFNYEPSLEQEDYIYVDPMEDWVHVDELQKYDDAKEHIEEIVHQVYNIGNVEALTKALEALTEIYDVDLPEKKPKLVKRRDEAYDFVVQLNRSLARLSKLGE